LDKPSGGSASSNLRSAATERPPDTSPSPIPSIALPKGGGAIRGIGEKFGANPVTGTASMTLPIFTSPGRSGFGPQLALSYDSGAGNGPFGLGWNLSVPSIVRKTEKGLPLYRDAEESDVFMLSEAEDLVPKLVQSASGWTRERFPSTVNGAPYTVWSYRPRVEGLFARIERWREDSTGTSFWRTISKGNVTSLYGISTGRIFDPEDTDAEHPSRIFKWLLEVSYDDKGNVVVYDYVAENGDNVPPVLPESNRQASANRYLKGIRYGNATPYYPELHAPHPAPLPSQWFFQVVFDYGEHDLSFPHIEKDKGVNWPARLDPFSSYRAGFEIRTYRLCRRVLMFHQFPELGPAPCLVRSTDFFYNPGSAASFLTSAQQTGYVLNPMDQSYRIVDPLSKEVLSPKSMPPVEFTYSEARVDDTLRFVDADAMENLPYGVDGGRYQWLDLDSEGSPGILTEQGAGWFYKRNVSNLARDGQGNVVPETAGASGTVRASFDPVQPVAWKPSLAALASGRQQFLDLAGEGRQCLVEFDRPVPGFYTRDEEEGGWQPFRPFKSSPNIDWTNPNLKTLDLDGDGHADMLISEDEVFTWYPSLGKDGFGPAEQVRKQVDEDYGPALVFADGTQSVYLADFSGDGLTDIVRIRNGEVCYWPNLGYGRFGAKVSMSNAPLFDTPDLFDQKRLRLGDIDGSGATDLVYLGRDQVTLYFNQAGNSWSGPRALTQFPAPDNLASVAMVDLLGNGTACLVWSSALPGDAGRQMRYVDLMGGQKPHLLISMKNNVGMETKVQYAASTRFYLQDRLAGMPWITKLPFPVHVVERVESFDYISRTRFASQYKYHHGYFDGVEREFRGFGMVERWDSEAYAVLGDSSALNLNPASNVPPVLTRTWFHTGAYLEGARISLLFKDQYYREPGLTPEQLEAMLLNDTVLPEAITVPEVAPSPYKPTAEEQREACRALKGVILRQEIYALDGTKEEPHPYSVSERNYTIQLLQPQGDNPHSVFFTHAREIIDYHYERKLFQVGTQQLADPRITHAINIAVDAYGNVQQSVAIGYGRRHDEPDPGLTGADRKKQTQTLMTLTESSYTKALLTPDQYRAPLPSETRTYELLNIAPQASLPLTTNLFRFDEMVQLVLAAADGQHDFPYEDIAAQGAQGTAPYRRLIEQVRTLYRKNDLSAPLSSGEIESLALPFESYKLAFTPGLLALFGSKISLADATNVLKSEGKYQDLDADGRLWIPSGQSFFSPDPANPDPLFAHDHFYLVTAAQDPFGNVSHLTYDTHDLLIHQIADPLTNTVSAGHDYRVLQPRKIIDPNGNRSEVAFDVLGMVAGTAVMGKEKEQEPDGKFKGDSLQGFVADVTESQINTFLTDPRGQAAALLGPATTRIIYHIDQFRKTGLPAFAATLARETHGSDLAPGQSSKVQVSFSYSDGFGREIQKKIPAEPGPIDSGGAPINPRWVGSGWVIFNNKGKPVRQYEPFFAATHEFEFAIQCGVSSTLFYDPALRVVATLHPNHTFEKVLFDPWRQENWDVNDTALLDPKNDPDMGDFFRRLPDADYLPTWYDLRTNANYAMQAGQRWPDAKLRKAETDAAGKAAAHAGTPAIVYLDTLGRTFLTIADNGLAPTDKYATRVELDIEGNRRSVTDALGRIVMTYDYDMLSTRIHQSSMEAGERWMLNDVAGKFIRAWDTRGFIRRMIYDDLHRPTELFVAENGVERLSERTVYGESQGAANNHRARIFQVFDGAGVVTSESYDFKGNLLSGSRQLLHDYKNQVDWSQSPALETESFSSSTLFDALNRPIQAIAPHSSLPNARLNVIQPSYNEANLLENVDIWLQQGSAPQAVLDFSTATLHAVTNIDYDAKGQRELIEYGNVANTRYRYDEQTFRMINLTTTRSSDNVSLQDLSYAFDPAGNITHIQDDSDIQNTIYFRNQRVEPSADYTYDALYHLTAATGREQLGLDNNQLNLPQQVTEDDSFRTGLLHPGDGNAVGRYTEQYLYDEVGNILQMIHAVGSNGWRRRYAYNEPSLIEPGKKNNRLSSTSLPGDLASGPYSAKYGYDPHGSMTTMPHLVQVNWDSKDQLSTVDLGGGGHAYYVYDAAGQRVRKVWEKSASLIEERIYLGGFEFFRRRNGGDVVLERETLHVMDDKRRIALVETKTTDAGAVAGSLPNTLIRYQFDNHLGSASLELDEAAALISYEEYFPYGSTSYQAGRNAAEVSLKRYRYTGKERDEETGLYYHGARYYAPWLGRWTAADPISIGDGTNSYAYVHGNPVLLTDPSGTQGSITLAPVEVEASLSLSHAAQDFATMDEFSTAQKYGGDARDLEKNLVQAGYLDREETPARRRIETSESRPTALRQGSAEDMRPLPPDPVQLTLETIEMGRNAPLAGVGAASAVAMGQRDPQKIKDAAQFAGTVGAVAGIVGATASARAEFKTIGRSVEPSKPVPAQIETERPNEPKGKMGADASPSAPAKPTPIPKEPKIHIDVYFESRAQAATDAAAAQYRTDPNTFMGYDTTQVPRSQLKLERGHMMESRMWEHFSQDPAGKFWEPVPYGEQAAGHGQLGDFRLKPEFQEWGTKQIDVTTPGGAWAKMMRGADRIWSTYRF
jgi:RHS repeat-associated protein